MTDPRHADSDELFWLAVRYVGDELADAERMEFENRLATDLTACAAVAEAVRLTAGLQWALQPTAGFPSRLATPPRVRQRNWLPVGLSAALLVFAGLLVTWWRVPANSASHFGPAELVSRWRSDAQSDTADDDSAWDDDWDQDVETAEPALAAPSWLVTAVQLSGDSEPESAVDPQSHEEDEET